MNSRCRGWLAAGELQVQRVALAAGQLRVGGQLQVLTTVMTPPVAQILKH